MKKEFLRTLGTVGYVNSTPTRLEEWSWCFERMQAHDLEPVVQGGGRIHYVRSVKSSLPDARNELVRMSIGDWLLMLDTDHVFEADLSEKMLKVMNVYGLDVLVALTQHKRHPFYPHVYVWEWPKVGEGGLVLSPVPMTRIVWDKEVLKTDIFRVDSSSAACLLVRLEVYNKIERELKEGPFDIIGALSEDHSFFLRCFRLGIKCHCAPHIRYPHLVMRGVVLEDYDEEEWKDKERVVETEGKGDRS